MIHESAEVVAVGKDVVWADCRARRDCERCAAGQGCGGALLGRLLGQRQHRVRARCATGAVDVGDTVRLELDEKTLLRGALLAYCVPLAGLLAGAVGGDALAADTGAAIGAGCGLFAGWAAAGFWARRHARDFDPAVSPQ